jgi:hypothetical protein
MTEEQATDAIRKASERRQDGRTVLSCAKAFALSRRVGMTPSQIGTICKRNDIRIAQCQLGCFP